jgi:hypothetical protein
MRTTQPYGPDGPTLPDDGKRYLLDYPRGIDRFADNLRPNADHHTIGVYGSADLARRMGEATTAGVDVSFRAWDDADADAAEA